MAKTAHSEPQVHGGRLIKAEKLFIINLLKAKSNRRRRLLKKASKKQLGAILQIAWNATNHRQARLGKVHKKLLKKFYSILHKAFFEITRVQQLRAALNTPGLLAAILAPLSSNRGLIASAVLNLLK